MVSPPIWIWCATEPRAVGHDPHDIATVRGSVCHRCKQRTPFSFPETGGSLLTTTITKKGEEEEETIQDTYIDTRVYDSNIETTDHYDGSGTPYYHNPTTLQDEHDW